MTSSREFQELSEANKRLKNWCIQEALPFWAMHGLDPNGGFYERLHMDGSPDRDALRRVRVQARLLYVYSHADYLEWFDGRDAARHLETYILTNGTQGADEIPGDGFKGIAHLLNPDASLNDPLRDTYAQAFVILGFSWRYRANENPDALKLAIQTVDFLELQAQHAAGGWVESIPLKKGGLPRRQNPHMHLFESLMALYEASGSDAYLKRATDIYKLFTDHFFDSNHKVIREYFNDDFSIADPESNVIEPGHMMEWVWLLLQYQRLSGKDTTPLASQLYTSALKYGLNQKTGLLCDQISLTDPQPTPSFRNWPLTEYIKAALSLSLISDLDPNAYAQTAAQQIHNLCDTYLNVPVRGGWRDQYDANGNAVAGPMQASTFYHLFCAAAEADRTITLLQEQ